jgi:hypothetical protein
MRREPLTAHQLFWTAFIMMFPTMLLMLPGALLRMGGRYAWCTPLVACLPAAALVWIVGGLAGRYGGLATVLGQAMGPVLGRLPLLVVWGALSIYVLTIVRESSVLAAMTFVVGDVPLWLLTLLGVFLAGVGAWLGLTVLARLSEFLGPVMVAAHVLLLAAAIPFVHVLWARPLIPRNADFLHLSPMALLWVWLAEPLATTLMCDHLDADARRRAGRALAGATVAAAAMTSLGLWVIVADFGPARGAQLGLPFFNLAKEITMSAFLQHLEALVIPIALTGSAAKTGVFFWLWNRAGTQLTGSAPARPLVIGMLGAGLAAGAVVSLLAFANAVSLEDFMIGVLARWALPALVAAVGAAYGVAALRRPGARA